jgi:hypothetical protein
MRWCSLVGSTAETFSPNQDPDRKSHPPGSILAPSFN